MYGHNRNMIRTYSLCCDPHLYVYRLWNCWHTNRRRGSVCLPVQERDCEIWRHKLTTPSRRLSTQHELCIHLPANTRRGTAHHIRYVLSWGTIHNKVSSDC